MAATLCLGLPAVHPSTCSGYPCVSGYESRQTTMFAQVAVTHHMLAGWDSNCRSFLMQYSMCWTFLIHPCFSSLASCMSVEMDLKLKDGLYCDFKTRRLSHWGILNTTYFHISLYTVLGFGNVRGRCQCRVLDA